VAERTTLKTEPNKNRYMGGRKKREEVNMDQKLIHNYAPSREERVVTFLTPEKIS